LRQESNLNLLPKLNQEIRPGAAIELFDKTGIAGWSVLDSIRTHLPKIKSLPLAGFPDLTFSEGTDSASLFGYWQLPLVCEYIYRLKTETNLPVLAGGGIRNAADIVQLLSLGADAIQVASSIIQDGPRWIKRAIDDLKFYNMDDSKESLPQSILKRAHIQIDKSLCSSCGCCSEQLMCTAIEMTPKGPIIQSEKCEGCGFCLDLCPSKAMSLSIV